MRAIVVCLLLALCGCVTAPANVPIDTSISEIQKDPRAWHGKIVRVRGTFDECISFTCQLCETEEELRSYNAALVRSNYGDGTDFYETSFKCMGVAFADKAQEELVRFSTSEIVSRYDAGCSRAGLSADIIVLCTDRASELRESRLERALVRRPSSNGVINMYGFEPLLIPNEATADAIRAAFDSSKYAQSKSETAKAFVFLEDLSQEALDYYGVSASGGLCQCKSGECTDSEWPKRSGEAWLPNSANPYTCWSAELVDGSWRFPQQ